MMKATIHEDVIVLVGTGKTEIGALPKRVGLERLRWDGERVIDLAALSTIFVREKNGVYELHAVAVPGSMPVAMTYADRKHLTTESGVIRVKTLREIAGEQAAQTDDLKDNRNLREQMVDLVRNFTYAKIDTHIDTVFANLNANQKNSLKKLYKVVLYLSKINLRRLSNG